MAKSLHCSPEIITTLLIGYTPIHNVFGVNNNKNSCGIFQNRKKEQRNQRSNCQHLLDHRKNKRNSRKTSTSASLIILKPLTLLDNNKLWKILKEMEIPDHLTYLVKNLYAGQEATVRTRHGTMDWFKIGKGVYQGGILSSCLFNLQVEYIIRNAGMDESQAERNQDCWEKY